MIQACIFDLDGVITDTAKYHFVAWRKLANRLGFDFDETFNERLKGVSRMESLDLILSKGGLTLAEDIKVNMAAMKNKWYQELVNKMTPEEVLPGVHELLDSLEANNIKIGLGSASKNAATVLEKLKITHRFETIIDGTKTTEAKPDPQVFLMGAEALGVDPKHTIVFEDAGKGVQAALNGGFIAVGIGSPEHLSHADYVISGLHEIDLEWVKNVKKQKK